MAILVTGSSGYIGQHLVLELIDKGEEVIGLDIKENPNLDLPGTYYIGDIGDRVGVRELFRNHQITSIMHLAASANVPDSVIRPLNYYENNVARSISLIQMALKANVKNFIFSSSAAVYGQPEESPIKESFQLCPVNPYGSTKVMIEKILEDCHIAHSINAVCFRYFCAAGADAKGRAGEDLESSTHIIPTLINRAFDGEEFVINGCDFDTPDGTGVRDFVHVTDIAQAHIAALGIMNKGPIFEQFNIGLCRGYSVTEVIREVESITGVEIRKVYGDRRPGDPASLVASPEKALNSLNWVPTHSRLEEIIRSTWEWKLKKNDY
jgi:UDP-glucose 4-epimerase